MENFMIKGAPTCRIVYPRGLFEKTQVKGGVGEPKYNAIILVPKDDAEKVAQVNELYMKAFKQLQDTGFKSKTPKGINPKNNCLQDGDEYADEKEGMDAFRGYLMLKVGSKNFRPIVTDKQKRIIINNVPLPNVDVERLSDEELHDGDYIFANVSFWIYNNSAAQGIGCNVHAVMRMADGEQIGGMPKSVDDYINTADYE